jgi:hypothetical protein
MPLSVAARVWTSRLLAASLLTVVGCSGGSSDTPDLAPSEDLASAADLATNEDLAQTPDLAEAPDLLTTADLLPTALAFVPGTHGFSFENYTNDNNPTNLTAVEMKALFGDAVCANGAMTPCVLTPAAEEWMQQKNAGMNGGHCEGMAVTSLFMQLGLLDANTFGGANAYALSSTPLLQREIARWFVTQFTEPSRAAEFRGTTADLLAKLQQSFAQSGAVESYTLGLYFPGGGHAITPYRVDDVGGGKYKIASYDNNYPGQERLVDIDLVAGTWTYTTSTNPSEPASAWMGKTTDGSLTVSPTTKRRVQQECPFCGNVNSGSSTAMAREVALTGIGPHLLLNDAQGNKLGYEYNGANGTFSFVSNLPGASAQTPRSGAIEEPIYSVPSGLGLTVTLDGRGLSATKPSEVHLTGPGYVLSVEGVQLDPMQVDTLTFSADWSEVSYQTQSNETPNVSVGFSTAGDDYVVLVKAAGEQTGSKVTLKLTDLVQGRMRVRIDSADGSAVYGIALFRIKSDGTLEQFLHVANSLSASDAVVLHYGEWAGEGQPMTIGLDVGADGTEDSTFTVTDEN